MREFKAFHSWYFRLANDWSMVWLVKLPGATVTTGDSPQALVKFMFITSETIRSAQSQDGAVLLDVHHGRMFSINPMGSKILDLVKEGRDEAQIADEIVHTYGIAIETARTDVHEFLGALCAHRIVIPMSGS